MTGSSSARAAVVDSPACCSTPRARDGLLFNSTSKGLLQHSVSPVYVVPRKFVETEAARAEAMPAETVQAASIDELVKEVPDDRAGEDVEREIESNIDPQAADYRDRRND